MAKYQIQKNSSVINWTGKKVLGLHTGTVEVAQGFVDTDGSFIKGAEVVIDMSSIIITDIADQQTSKDFKDHLFHEDFFSVEKFPTARLSISKAASLEKGQYKLEGNLTIKDITHPISFTAKVETFSSMLHSMGEIVIDRTMYNIRYGSGKFVQGLGDKLIYDDFVLQFKLIGEAV